MRWASYGTRRLFPPGTTIFEHGAEATDAYLIVEGAIKLVWSDGIGSEIIVGLRWPGWFLGAAAVIAGRPYATSAVTLVSTSLEQIESSSFLSRLLSDEELNWRVHQSHSVEIMDQSSAASRASTSSQYRLRDALQQAITHLGPLARASDGRFVLPINRRELAQLIFVTPEHLSRLLREFVREDLIRLERGWIIIPDPKKLSNKAI